MAPMEPKSYEYAYILSKGDKRAAEKAIEYFFNLFNSQLVYHSYRIIKDKQGSEDIVIDSFVKLWNTRETMNHPMVIKSWLYVTVKNGSLNYLASQKRKVKKETEYFKSVSEAEPRNVEDVIITEETNRNLRMFLSFLPNECCRIMLMFYQGFKAKEIATILNKNESTVKSLFAIGKKKLFKEMGNDKVASALISIVHEEKRLSEYVYEEH